MFNLLNNAAGNGNNPPMVCKFMDLVSAFLHARLGALRGPFYLLERMGLRNHALQSIGLRIAFSTGRAAVVPFRMGKACY
jgi:hypothetical protein